MIYRKPLDLREAHIFHRMKNVLKLSVTIATVVERNNTSVYKALDPYFEPEERGHRILVFVSVANRWGTPWASPGA